MTFEQLLQKKIDFIPNSESHEQILTSNFIRNGLCHEDRWEVFFHHVVKNGHVWIHWPSIEPWLKDMPLRGDEFWMAREFISLWETDVIRALPEDCGDAELPAIVQFKEKYAPHIQAIVGTVDEWLTLRESLSTEEMAF